MVGMLAGMKADGRRGEMRIFCRFARKTSAVLRYFTDVCGLWACCRTQDSGFAVLGLPRRSLGEGGFGFVRSALCARKGRMFGLYGREHCTRLPNLQPSKPPTF